MADKIQATPRNPFLGLLSDAYGWMQSPQRTQQLQGFAGLLGTTGIPQTIERMAYGEPLTNIGRANVPLLKPETADALMNVAPFAGPAARGAGRLAGSAVNEAMVYGRGPLAAITPQPMRVIEKNPAPFIVKHGTNQPFDEFKSGMGVTAKHIYTTPEEYAQDAAKYGDTLITAQASPKSLIDFSSEGKLDKQTISALKKAAKDAGITDKYYPFESFMDDLMNGQLYQKGGGSRDQDALLSELFSKYQAVKMPDATSGGGISKSVVFEDPSLLNILPNEGLLGQQAKSAFTYPQEEAMRLAQQRAALPVEQGGLGLAADNTAEQRAAAMGFESGWAHGSPNPDITNLKPSITGAQGEGIYATNYLPEANMYSGSKEGATNYPLYVKTKSALNVGEENPYDVLGFDLQGQLSQRQKDAIISKQKETEDWLIKNGVPMMPSREHYVSTLPENFRSRFAAFDPWRKTSAIAAAMGVAAPDLLAQEQPQSAGLLYPLP